MCIIPQMSSFLPRIANLHLNVTDLHDEDILSHIEVAVAFIREAIANGGNVLVHCFRLNYKKRLLFGGVSSPPAAATNHATSKSNIHLMHKFSHTILIPSRE